MFRRAARAAVAALACLLPFAASAQACVWFGGKDAISQVTAGALSASLPARDAQAIAMNGQDCGLWVLGRTELRRHDVSGALVLTVPLQAIDRRLDLATHLAVDPYDGSVWLAGDRILAHLSSTGTLLALPAFEGNVRGLAVALDQSAWLLGNKQISRFSAVGTALPAIDLKLVVASEAKRLAVDSIAGAVWTSTNKNLLQLKPAESGQVPVNLRTSNAIGAIALEPTTGRLWVAEAGALHVYDSAGALALTVNLAGQGVGSAESVAFDPAGKALWLWTKDGVTRLSVDGVKEAFFPAQYGSGLLAVPAFWVQPRISLVEPPQDAITNNARRLISIGYDAQCNGEPCSFAPSYLASYSLTAALNSQQVGPAFVFNPDTKQATFTPVADLPQGTNTLQAQAKDASGRLSNSITGQFTVDTVAPVVTVTSPQNGAVTNMAAQAVNGSVNEPATVLVNNNSVSVSPAGTFTASVTLLEGPNQVNLVAVDRASNTGNARLDLTLDTQRPAAPVSGAVSVSTPNGGTVTVAGAAGAVEGGSKVTVTNTRTGAAVVVTAATNGSFSAQISASGGTGLSVSVTDAAGNQGPAASISVPGGLPPDPATVATPIDPTVPTQMAASTAFLYSGNNPVQTGVAPGTIEARRVAVLRGKVMTRDEQPLAGVTITILGHPELGQTMSRPDGVFDMAVNGGGYLTINYAREGFLPVQRTLSTPWQDYLTTPDVVMLQLDAQATTVNLNGASEAQVARGSAMTDASGTRQVTLLFAPGTTATMTLSDGTTRPLAGGTVRATEYTVGPNGPLAMPGALPATSGYTYAVEFSVDEAITAGAKEVRFSKPVTVYVDNFLQFPVGTAVPLGYYDRDKAAWIPAPNGKIIRILGATNGLADIDVTGTGVAADAGALGQLGIDNVERQKLASLYQPGQSIWRVRVDHFTPWDCNWPYGPPDGAVAPSGDPKVVDPLKDPNCECGSIIESQNQVLGESVPVVGTPFKLHYRSDRAGDINSRTINIPLSGPTLPAIVKRIELEVRVGGTRFARTFDPLPAQTTSFTWNGRDAYGRPVRGAQLARVRIGYVYDAIYRTPATFERSFAIAGASAFSNNQFRTETAIWKDSEVVLRGMPAATGFGGWTLDTQHLYDSVLSAVQRGDGRRGSALDIRHIVRSIPGTEASRIALDAAGNVYFADGNDMRIRKVSPDGTVTIVAGNGTLNRASPDGGLATQTGLALISAGALAVDAKGVVYFNDGAYGFGEAARIRKVTPDGIISTVVGSGQAGYSPDGLSAKETKLGGSGAMAIDSQGNIIYIDSANRRVRKVSTDGTVTSLVGDKATVFGLPANSTATGDGGPAADARVVYPLDLTIDAQDNVYIVDGNVGDPRVIGHRVRKITPDGIISTVAGVGASGVQECWRDTNIGDGGPATSAKFCFPKSIAVDGVGNIYVGQAGRIRKIGSDGVITTLAGRDVLGFGGDNGPAARATLETARGVALDAKGTLYFGDSSISRIRTISPAYPGAVGSVSVAADTGAQLFEFDGAGRHLRTISSLTGADVYRFSYEGGHLTRIVDADGNVTHVERDSNDGRPLAIVAPDGQRTILTIGTDGNLAAVANPANEVIRLSYTGDGLLTEFKRPNGQSSTMSYDSVGRLLRDQNAAGGFWSLSRTDLSATAFQVDLQTALNSTKRVKVEQLPVGDVRRTNTATDGTTTTILKKPGASTQTTAPDGTVMTVQEGPDPRFGMQSPVTNSVVVRLSSGLTNTTTFSREALLANPGDLLSLTTQVERTSFNGKTFTNTFDAALRQYTMTTPLNRMSVAKVDAQDRPLSAQVTGVEPVTYSYDNRGRVMAVTQGSGADARTSSFIYNSQGWVASATDSLGRTVGYEYDLAGRVTRKTLPGNRTIGFAYDANGNVTSITPPSRPPHGFSYTSIDLEEQYAPPAVSGVLKPATQYAYNLDKQLTTISRPDGQTVQFGYDSGGRLATITAPYGTTTYAYTPIKGTLATIAAPGAGLAYTYDGFLLLSEAWSGSIAGSVARTYNNDFDLKTLNVAGTTTAFSYDNDRLLTGAGALTIGRDAGNGFIKTTQLGTVATSQSYTAFGELQQYQASQGGATVLAQAYSYDKLGRIVQKLETVQGQTDSYGYEYDPAGRLITVSKNGVVITAYQYDANGNRTSDGVNQASYDEQDRLVQYGSATYAYTENGELKSLKVGGQETGYNYDTMGNLRSASLPDGKAIEYIIDGRNRRIGKKVNGVLTQGLLYMDQLKPVAELDAGGVKARFIYGTKINVPDYMEKGGKTYRIVSDHLGSVRMVVDSATGEIAQRMDYDAFGFVIQDTNPGFHPFGFAGGLYDQDTKLVRFGARDYDAFTGRWTTKDPIWFNGGDANLFSYVGGNPINFIDPLGLEKMILLPKNDLNYPAAAAAPDAPGVLTIFSHANPQKLNGMDAKTLAEFIKNSGLWKPGMPIKLEACRTAEGESNLARELAKLLGTPVTGADTRNLSFGERMLGPWHSVNIPGTERTIPYWPGNWKTYSP